MFPNYSLFTLSVMSVCLLLTGCGSFDKTMKENAAGTTPAASESVLRIAVIPKGTTHSYWKSLHAGAEKAGQELGVEIIWQGPQKEDDRQMQIQTVQNFVSQGINAIVLAPLDERALVPPVAAARKRQIPVIIIDSDLQSDAYLSFIATDNKLAGKLSAKRLCEQLNGRGKVVLMRYNEGSASATARENGFLEGLKEYGPNVELISSNQYAGVTIEKAFQTAQNLLNLYPQVDGIFTPTEVSTQGMLRALQMSGKAGKVKFVGFDSNATLLEALEKGQLHGLAVQDPFRMGYEGVKTAVAALNKQSYEKRIDTGVMLITKETLNDAAVKELLNPDLNKWLKE